jgi:hypothetical protein
MSEMDLHGDVEPVPDPVEDLETSPDPEAPEPDALEQALTVTEPEPDHEVVPQDEDEYR